MKNNSNKKRGVLRVGTSGIALPGSKQTFPPAFRDKSRLTYYSSLFNTIEINSTFYKLPQQKTLLRWSGEVPPDFQFTVKLWKEITHAKELKYKSTDVDLFMQTVVFPRAQQGCLLIQFPGKITFDYFQQVVGLLERIVKRNRSYGWRLCVEFRHSSWYNNQVYLLLSGFHAALVIHDIPASRNVSVHTTADFIYLRFHGEAGDYKGSYSEEYLDAVAVRAAGWLKTGKDVYACFNNTMGNAFGNAIHILRAGMVL